jgi:hypothetical protein
MPVRRQVSREVAEQFAGIPVWNGLTGTCQTMPTADYDKTREAADCLFAYVVDLVDWNRILLEAAGRHATLERAGQHPAQRYPSTVDGLCPGCLRGALLADDRLIDWLGDAVPADPVVDYGHDWAADLAAAVTYRRTTNGAT